MANFLRDAVAQLRQTAQDEFSEAVTYRRGSTTAELRATLGHKLLKVTDEDTGEIKLLHADQDFIFSGPAFRPIFGGPQKADRVDWNGETYEVAPPSPGEQEWQAADPFGELLRVFCKHVGAAAAAPDDQTFAPENLWVT